MSPGWEFQPSLFAKGVASLGNGSAFCLRRATPILRWAMSRAAMPWPSWLRLGPSWDALAQRAGQTRRTHGVSRNRKHTDQWQQQHYGPPRLFNIQRKRGRIRR